MKIQPDQYLLAKKYHKQDSGKAKIYLLRVESLQGDLVTGTLQTPTVHLNPVKASFNREDVVANLGLKPTPGKAYGFDLSKLYRGERSLHPDFPEFHVFSIPTKENRLAFSEDIGKLLKLLKRNSIEFLLEETAWEIVPKNGKYSGMFMRSKDVRQQPDRIQIAVTDETRVLEEGLGFRYVLAHELGHKMHLRYAGPEKYPKLNAKWLQLYQTSIERRETGKDTCRSLLNKLVKAETFMEFTRGLTEDERKSLRVILHFIRLEHNLSKLEVGILHSTRDPERLKQIWPSKDLFGAKANPILTLYATKNFKELVAETFALHLLGKSVPKALSELMDSTIAQARKSWQASVA